MSGGAAPTAQGAGPAVKLEHVTKSFGGHKVLDDITFEIPRAKAFVLLGRSGTGKSVTLRHIIGLVQPDTGHVFVDGRDITQLLPRALANVAIGQVGMAAHRKGDVVADGHRVEERGVLKQKPHLLPDVRQATPIELVNDDALYRQTASIAKSAEQIADNAREVVEQARKALADLQSKNGPVQGMAADLRQTMEGARDGMSGFAENMEALKRNFLFRGFFNTRGFFSLADISPTQYRQGILTKNGERAVVRIWLGAQVLFEQDPDDPGADRLTDAGKMRLDSAMQPYLPHLGDGVFVVEGYAQRRTKDEQFLLARARSSMVRDYLIGKFHLNAQTIGIMPLGGDSIDSPDNRPWDGVALAAFLNRAALAARRK